MKPNISLKCARGFTLIELLAGFFIMFVVLGLAWVAVSGMLENQRVNESERQLATIRERLIDFAVRNGRLPCPADPQSVGGADYGEEWMVDTAGPNVARVCGSTNQAYPALHASGAVPWATLRVAQTDPWGQRYVYTVDSSWAEIDDRCDPIGLPRLPACARPFPPVAATALQVQTRRDPGTPSQAIALDLAAVVVSHGSNGLGGYREDATRRPFAPGADEIANHLPMGTGAGTSFAPVFDYRLRTRTPASAICNDAAGPGFCEFDDQAVYIPRHILIARLVEAGRVR